MRPFMQTFVAAACLATASFAVAQEIRAITEDGRKVILTSDGKWRFDSSAAASPKAGESGSPYQTAVRRFSVAYDTAEWSPVPNRDGEGNAKRTFKHKRLPIFSMVLADEMPTTTPTMKSIILSNAQAAGATTTVLVDQPLNFGGKEIGTIRFAAQMQGLEFVFTSYYYADGDGNLQVTCYTAQSLFHKYQADCQKFLEGLMIK